MYELIEITKEDIIYFVNKILRLPPHPNIIQVSLF